MSFLGLLLVLGLADEVAFGERGLAARGVVGVHDPEADAVLGRRRLPQRRA